MTITDNQEEIEEELGDLLLKQADLLSKIKKALKQGRKQEVMRLIEKNEALSQEILVVAEKMEA